MKLRYTGKSMLRRYNGKALINGELFECNADDVDAMLTLPDVEPENAPKAKPLSEETTPPAGLPSGQE